MADAGNVAAQRPPARRRRLCAPLGTELARLPDACIHRPAEAPTDALAAAGVTIGETYPAPIVDLGTSRRGALAALAEL